MIIVCPNNSKWEQEENSKSLEIFPHAKHIRFLSKQHARPINFLDASSLNSPILRNQIYHINEHSWLFIANSPNYPVDITAGLS